MIKQHFVISIILSMLAVPALGFAQSSVDRTVCSETDAKSLLSAFTAYTDLRIRSVQRSLEILASTTNAMSGNWEKMQNLLHEYQKSDEGLIVWYVRPDGTYYTVDKGLMDKTLRDRRYFPSLMAGKKIDGALVVSKSTGQRSAVIAVPIKMGNKVVGAIGASLFLDKFAEQISAVLNLRPNISFFALAPSGLTALHLKRNREFLDPREMGSASLKKAANEMLSGTAGKTSYVFDNVTKHALYQTSPVTHWRFVITLSESHKTK